MHVEWQPIPSFDPSSQVSFPTLMESPHFGEHLVVDNEISSIEQIHFASAPKHPLRHPIPSLDPSSQISGEFLIPSPQTIK